jgi:ATP-dependent 26S proteasome regulatory subunit
MLILTTNRVGTFDEAFKSRIQLALHFENLTVKSRMQIWRNFLDACAAEQDVDRNEIEERLDELAAYKMNGRQIRNVVTTSRQLAKFRNSRMGWDTVRKVLDTTASFDRYLQDIRREVVNQSAE